MKAFQRSAFLYRSASALRGAHAFGASATIFFQASIPLSTDCLAASLAAFALLVSSEGRSSGTPLPLVPGPLRSSSSSVALALALLGLVIHCAPPDSDPYRLLLAHLLG
jgi:hypothetical protein